MKSFVVKLSRSGRELTIGSDQSVLKALLAAGLDLPIGCMEGFCGICEVPVLAGSPDHRDSALARKERAANDRLIACCSRSLTDSLVLDL